MPNLQWRNKATYLALNERKHNFKVEMEEELNRERIEYRKGKDERRRREKHEARIQKRDNEHETRKMKLISQGLFNDDEAKGL